MGAARNFSSCPVHLHRMTNFYESEVRVYYTVNTSFPVTYGKSCSKIIKSAVGLQHKPIFVRPVRINTPNPGQFQSLAKSSYNRVRNLERVEGGYRVNGSPKSFTTSDEVEGAMDTQFLEEMDSAFNPLSSPISPSGKE